MLLFCFVLKKKGGGGVQAPENAPIIDKKPPSPTIPGNFFYFFYFLVCVMRIVYVCGVELSRFRFFFGLYFSLFGIFFFKKNFLKGKRRFFLFFFLFPRRRRWGEARGARLRKTDPPQKIRKIIPRSSKDPQRSKITCNDLFARRKRKNSKKINKKKKDDGDYVGLPEILILTNPSPPPPPPPPPPPLPPCPTLVYQTTSTIPLRTPCMYICTYITSIVQYNNIPVPP